MKYLNNYPKLNLLINAPFKNLGKGNFDKLQNSILKNTIYIMTKNVYDMSLKLVFMSVAIIVENSIKNIVGTTNVTTVGKY